MCGRSNICGYQQLGAARLGEVQCSKALYFDALIALEAILRHCFLQYV